MNDAITILHVEDEHAHARLVERNLRRAGIESDIVHFEDGVSVLEYLQEALDSDHEHFLILLDLNLPIIDGFEVLASLRGEKKTKVIPVVIFSTTSLSEEIRKCYELGCNLYVKKPIDYERFVEVINRLAGFLSYIEYPDIGED